MTWLRAIATTSDTAAPSDLYGRIQHDHATERHAEELRRLGAVLLHRARKSGAACL